ncbi:MAG: phospholipid carrier-dependent glycosyltransferase, partial [Gallionellaceae bacterium]|nr:phospholipid carrier-dependent glycosyltransferase [Gallionellaceae bacterium]
MEPSNKPPVNLARPWLWLLLAVAVIWFGNIEYRHLIEPDEGRYAEIPREMVASGDWVTPRLNDLKYFEKPPLQYWATAIAYTLFGEHHWTSRLWTALTGF